MHPAVFPCNISINTIYCGRFLVNTTPGAPRKEFHLPTTWKGGMAKRYRPTPTKQELLATISELRAAISQLEAKIAKLEKRNAELEDALAKAKKNSSNSSKRPSGDIIKPPKPARPGGADKRKRGGQTGHTKYERQPFGPDEIDGEQDYPLSTCPHCGSSLVESDQFSRIIDQIEIDRRQFKVERHRCPAYWYPHCKKVHFAPFPPDVKHAGLIGPPPDRSDWLYERRLPRFVLDGSQIPARRRRSLNFPGATSENHHQGDQRLGATMVGVARELAPRRDPQRR